ncbi:MAG: carbon-nitrogen hydrolase family protein [Chloroflexi bacterium]|nr:carbon-nitrogen hydrolase family protein [Chloroflexota bacterium]
MSETYPRLRVAAVQAAPVFLDREATTRKACDLILEAGANGARFIVFPECFIPAFPYWFDFYPASDPICQRANRALFANSVEVPSPTTDRLASAARQAGAYVVMGLNERRAEIMGTMYNAQLFLGPDGRLIGKRRKVMPTMCERLVHGMGDGTGLAVFPSEFGPMGGLICGENGNPLFKFVLAAQGERLHAAGWPAKTSSNFARGIENMVLRARCCSMEANSFGVHAAGIFSAEMCDLLELNEAVRKDLRPGGGSCVVGPSGELIAGPAGGEEMILYAEVDLGDIVAAKLRQDFTGHYNRFDLIGVTLNAAPALPLRIISAPASVGGVPEGPGSAEARTAAEAG